MALRHAFFTDSRPISLLHEIVDVAQGGCDSVDAETLRHDLDDGAARGEMMRSYRQHADEVQGSPHFFFPDGSDVHNPRHRDRVARRAGRRFPGCHEGRSVGDRRTAQALRLTASRTGSRRGLSNRKRRIVKAVVFKGVGEIGVDDVADPPKLEQPTDAIIRITTSAICGTDLHLIRGTMPGMKAGTVLGA